MDEILKSTEQVVISVICCKFQNNLFDFFFMILYMYIAPEQGQIAPEQGQTAPRGQNFDLNRNVVSLYSFVASFKKCL